MGQADQRIPLVCFQGSRSTFLTCGPQSTSNVTRVKNHALIGSHSSLAQTSAPICEADAFSGMRVIWPQLVMISAKKRASIYTNTKVKTKGDGESLGCARWLAAACPKTG